MCACFGGTAITTSSPSRSPSGSPSLRPTSARPTTASPAAPTVLPTTAPTRQPTAYPSAGPTLPPTAYPSASPTPYFYSTLLFGAADVFDGALGDRAATTAYCNGLAEMPGDCLPGSAVAFLAYNATDTGANFPLLYGIGAGLPVATADGLAVAATWADFLAGPLYASLDTEYENPGVFPAAAWTGMDAAGGAHPPTTPTSGAYDNCFGWTFNGDVSAAGSGVLGGDRGAGWLESGAFDCHDLAASVVCVCSSARAAPPFSPIPTASPFTPTPACVVARAAALTPPQPDDWRAHHALRQLRAVHGLDQPVHLRRDVRDARERADHVHARVQREPRVLHVVARGLRRDADRPGARRDQGDRAADHRRRDDCVRAPRAGDSPARRPSVTALVAGTVSPAWSADIGCPPADTFWTGCAGSGGTPAPLTAPSFSPVPYATCTNWASGAPTTRGQFGTCSSASPAPAFFGTAQGLCSTTRHTVCGCYTSVG